MPRRWIAGGTALLLAALAGGAAFAQFNGCPAGFCGVSAGVTPPPPTCSNSLDLTDQCNSQYAGALAGGLAP